MKVSKKVSEWRQVFGGLRMIQTINIPCVQMIRVGKILKTLQDELTPVDEQQNALLKKYGTRDETTGNYSLVGAKAIDDFEAEIKPVLDEVVELEFQHPINLKALERYDLPPVSLMYAMDLCEE